MEKRPKVIIYGAGGFAKTFLHKYIDAFAREYLILNIVDSNYENCQSLCGYSIKSPEIIRDTQFDYICILSMYYVEEMKGILIQKYGIEENKIKSNYELLIRNVGLKLSANEDLDLIDNQLLVDYLLFDNNSLNEEMNMWLQYKELKERYSFFLRERNLHVKDGGKKSSKKIWFCWLQGIENAPDLVKACYNSIKKQMLDYEIIIVTEENLHGYIEVSPIVQEKYLNGKMCAAHYSDYLRCELLIKYGGIWMDATVLLTNKIPDNVLNSSFLMFDLSGYMDVNTRKSSNWFIVSEPENRILTLVRDMLVKYWSESDNAVNYYIMHIFIRMVFELNENEWNSMNHMAVNAYLMARALNNTFDSNQYEFIKSVSFIHKLTNKRKIDTGKDNVYNYILKEFL